MKRFLIILFTCFLSQLVTAQSELLVLESILDFRVSPSENFREEVLVADYDYRMSDYGLQAFASYQRRFDDGFIDDDISLNSGHIFYKAGIEWDILKEGWLHNRNRAAISSLEAQLVSEGIRKEEKKQEYYAQFALAAYLYDVQISERLTERLKALQAQQKLLQALKDRQLITNEPLLVIEERADVSKLTLNYLNNSNLAFQNIFKEYLSEIHFIVSELDFTNLSLSLEEAFDEIDQSMSSQAIIDLFQQKMERELSYVSEISLSANLSYNRQISFSDNKRDFAAFGVSLRAPIHFNRKHLKNKANLELEQQKFEQEFITNNAKKELLTLYNEFSYKQKQLKAIEATKIKVQERLRVKNVLRKSVGISAPEEHMQFLEDDLFALEIEKLGLEKQIVQSLLKMNLLLPDSEITQFISVKQTELLTSNKEVK